LIVNEVMAAGRPVIVSDEAGCVADLVHPGQNGYTFPTGDITALAEALYNIVSCPRRAEAMGTASKEIIERWSYAEDLAGLRQALHANSSHEPPSAPERRL
jgi:glycosyltransferase involved in cell wall biosynthesis